MLKNYKYDSDPKDAVLTDYISLEYLQKLQDSISAATNSHMVIMDAAGNLITEDSIELNEYFRGERRMLGLVFDKKIKKRLIEKVEAAGQEIYVMNEDIGLVCAALPIYMEGTLLGIWMVHYVLDVILEKEAFVKNPEVYSVLDISMVKDEANFKDVVALIKLIIAELLSLVQSKLVVYGQNKELKSIADKLTSTLTLLEDFINVSDFGMYLVYADTGELIMANSIYAHIHGLELESVPGQICFKVLGYDTWCPYCNAKKAFDKDGNTIGPVVWENYVEEIDSWFRITSKNVRWVDGRLAHMLTFLDITDQKKHHEEIEYLAYNDQRLKVPNCAKLYKDIQKVNVKNSYLIVFDIRGLRHLNGAYGNEIGDALLEAVKQWAVSEEGLNTKIYRIDGDSFAALYPMDTIESVYKESEKLFERFKKPWRLDKDNLEQKLYTSVTIGIIPVEKGITSYSDLVNTIERMLLAAKMVSKPLVYDAQLDRMFLEKVRLEGSLKSNVLNDMNGFYIEFQPIVEPNSEVWVGLEALCRWVSPELGAVCTEQFISEAEQMGLIGQIGYWILERAVAQVKAWGLDRYPEFVLDVNLSPLQLNDENLAERIQRILTDFDYPPSKLSLELTEGVEIHFEDSYVQESFNKLMDIGVRLAMDDFGIGYASFSNLNHLPFTTLKTDRSFMVNFETDKFLQHTLKVMVEFAHLANMYMIVEGIETAMQAEMVTALGADLIQGFHYSKPLSIIQVEENLHRFAGRPLIERRRKQIKKFN